MRRPLYGAAFVVQALRFVADALTVPGRVVAVRKVRPAALQRIPAFRDLHDVSPAEATNSRLHSRRRNELVTPSPGTTDDLPRFARLADPHARILCRFTLKLAPNHASKRFLSLKYAQLVTPHKDYEILEVDEFFRRRAQSSLTGLPREPPVRAAALHIRGGKNQR